MPAAAEDSGPQRHLSTIYRQNWPPPSENRSSDNSQDKKPPNHPKNGGERPRSSAARINRPFSARLISPRSEKRGARPMSARSCSQLKDARGLNSATFQKRNRTRTNSRIPEYDAEKVISDSAAARNRALAAEYIAMLQGRNYMKKQYREQYWINDITSDNRPPTGRYGGDRRYPMLYPDLGSVIGGRAPYVAGTGVASNSPPRSAGPWRLSTPSTSSQIPAAKNSMNAPERSTSEISTTVSEIGLTFATKKSWSNVPSGKCYRVLSHPNDTLASLCLEGRSASRTSNSRTSSLSSTISISGAVEVRRALSSTGESTPSGSSEAISGQSRPASGDEDQTKSFAFIGTEDSESVTPPSGGNKTGFDSDQEFSAAHGMPDSVFADEDVNGNRDKEEEGENEDEYEENLREGGAGRLSYSDLEESDISENEADDYDEEVVDENEVNRRLQQVSAVFDTSRDSSSPNNNLGPIAIVVESASDGESSDTVEDEFSDNSRSGSSTANNVNNYEFADFFPQPYKEYDLRLFAALPAGMDWRAFVQPNSPKRKGPSRQQLRRSDTEKRRAERRTRERQEKRKQSLEETVDRLIMLEKMQALTVQYEQDRRRHLMHRAKARSLAKAASNNQINAASSTPANNEIRPQSARVTRRRSSTVSAVPSTQVSSGKLRKSLSSLELPIEAMLNKSAPDLVRLSCSKTHLQYLRHSSFSCTKRTRFGHPRHYEYAWSERVPPSKRPSLNCLVYTKPRNCQSCRESDKRLAHLHTVQMMLGRPRSSYCTFSTEQQKLNARPNTSNASARGGTDNSQASKENRFSKDRTASEKSKSKSPSRDIGTSSSFGRPATANRNSNLSGQEKISAARAILSSVARDYVRASRRGGKLSRRSSAPNITATRSGRTSPGGIIRHRKDANVLKTNVIDCSNLSLR